MWLGEAWMVSGTRKIVFNCHLFANLWFEGVAGCIIGPWHDTSCKGGCECSKAAVISIVSRKTKNKKQISKMKSQDTNWVTV